VFLLASCVAEVGSRVSRIIGSSRGSLHYMAQITLRSTLYCKQSLVELSVIYTLLCILDSRWMHHN
jgi:hypothetical protein